MMKKKLDLYDELTLFFTSGVDPTWVPFEGNLYKFFETPRTQSAAEAECRTEGAHLAKILNQNQENFLKSYIMK